MTSNVDNSKRIAKNTLLLYFRMILIMIVSLYTSRVILEILGVTDFGIYNLVAGIVVLFSFLNNSMISATQRYLSISIGEDDREHIQQVFSTSLLSVFILILVLILLTETIGLWIVNKGLDIPSERLYVTNIIYQIAIVTMCVNIFRVPYHASIISNERMNFYAYVSILEAILKLVIVWILLLSDLDKLILYSVLLLGVNVFINLIFIYYCITYLDSNKFLLYRNCTLLKEMLSFTSWNMFGGIADIGYKQGTNIILNVFCGVALNATSGIINQIRTAVFSFVGNLQSAANPQIIKSYAAGDFRYFRTLVCRISKYSYFLMLIIAIPLLFNVDLVLNLWLGTPPPYTETFTVLTLIFCLVDSLTGPLWVSMQASGYIKSYQIVISICLLMNLPISYLFLSWGYPPLCVLIIQIIVALFTFIIRIVFLQRYLHISILFYFREVLFPICIVTTTSLILPVIISILYDNEYTRLVLICFSTIGTLVSIYLLGISKDEKSFLIKRFIQNRDQ